MQISAAPVAAALPVLAGGVQKECVEKGPPDEDADYSEKHAIGSYFG